MTDTFDRLKTALADRYAIQEEIGAGGMATVYLAEDLKHHRRVAVKVLRPELAAALGPERFLREIEIAAGLTHPHVLPLHDSGEADGFLYYVMPYIEGESLRERLAREKQLPLDDAVQIAREVADALGSAHSHDVIHRDIKPENILLEEGHAVVADFGIARAITAAGGEQLTETGLAIGTPAYMSPEQAAGSKELDGRSDVYSLGCVLYEMLAGQPPFTGPTVESIVHQHLTVEPPSITNLRPAVPGDVAAVLARCLAKTPADRFSTAAQLAESLERGVAVAPRAVGTGVGGRRRLRLGAAALGVAAALAVGWWGVSELGTGAPSIQSLVVLPLDNLTGHPEQEYFVEGMHEALTAELSRISGLKVISRTSAMQYKGARKPAPQIARELGVDGLIEGSVAREGDQVRITVQLIYGPSDEYVWGDSYQRELRGILALQREVALEIARQVRVRLTTAEERRLAGARAVHPEAYDLYLRGRHFKHQEGEEDSWFQALAALEQSVAIDSSFAPAWAGLAMMYALQVYGPWPDSAAPARMAVEKALALDPNLSDAYVSLALVRQLLDWDWNGAEDAFRRALELDPSNWEAHYEYGLLLIRLGRLDEALAATQRALALEPLSTTAYHGVGLAHIYARRYDEAIEILRNALELHPNSSQLQPDYASALQLGGFREEGEKARKKYYALCCGTSEAEYQELPEVRFRRYLASGERGKALELLRDWERVDPPNEVFLAQLYLELGDKDQALRLLEQAAERRIGFINWIKVRPQLDPLRSEPRFQALLKKVGLH